MNSEHCDYCGINWNRPSIDCENENQHKTPDLADKIVYQIELYLTDRRGLRQEFESIDREIQTEIRDKWANIIRKELKKEEEV